MVKKLIYIDIDGVLANIAKAVSEYKALYPEQPYPQSQYGFFMNMEPIDNAIETVMKLTDHFNVWFLTAPSYKNPLCYTEKAVWIKKHFGEAMLERLIICSNKSLCYGDYLIDDNAFGRGQDKFTGELIHFGSESFKDWKAVYNYLIKPISKINESAIFIEESINGMYNTFKLGIHSWLEDKEGNIIEIYDNDYSKDLSKYKRKFIKE